MLVPRLSSRCRRHRARRLRGRRCKVSALPDIQCEGRLHLHRASQLARRTQQCNAKLDQQSVHEHGTVNHPRRGVSTPTGGTITLTAKRDARRSAKVQITSKHVIIADAIAAVWSQKLQGHAERLPLPTAGSVPAGMNSEVSRPLAARTAIRIRVI